MREIDVADVIEPAGASAGGIVEYQFVVVLPGHRGRRPNGLDRRRGHQFTREGRSARELEFRVHEGNGLCVANVFRRGPCAGDAGEKNRQASAIIVAFMVERIGAVRAQVFELNMGLLLPEFVLACIVGTRVSGQMFKFSNDLEMT